jgi:hypothetical protein
MGIITPDDVKKDSIPALLNRLAKITDPQAAVDRASELRVEWEAVPRTAPPSPKEKEEIDSRQRSWEKRAKAFLKTVE